MHRHDEVDEFLPDWAANPDGRCSSQYLDGMDPSTSLMAPMPTSSRPVERLTSLLVPSARLFEVFKRVSQQSDESAALHRPRQYHRAGMVPSLGKFLKTLNLGTVGERDIVCYAADGSQHDFSW